MTCGKPLVSGTRFCGQCGAGNAEPSSTSVPAPSAAQERSLAATNENGPLRKPLSAWQGFLIAVGLLLLLFAFGYVAGEAVAPFAGLVVLGTSIWACIDSYRIRQKYRDTGIAHPVGLLVIMLLLWIVVFPVYLVKRSRVLATPGMSAPQAFSVGVAVLCALGFVVLGSAALYVSSGGSVKGIWATTGSDVNIVRNGVLKAFNTTTVGKAFEGTFQNPKWTSFETPKKEVVVEFNGTITAAAAQKGGVPLNYEVLIPLKDGCALGLGDAIKQAGYDIKEDKSEALNNLSIRKRNNDIATDQYLRDNPRYSQMYSHRFDSDVWEQFWRQDHSDDPGLQALQKEGAAITQEVSAVKQSIAEINRKIKECVNNKPIPVRVQFILSADKKTFKIQYIDEAFGSAELNRVLAFVYQ